MNKILYIKANAKSDNMSRTYRISNNFIELYKKANPEDEIITLDLYKEGIKSLTLEDINTIFGVKTDDSKNHPILKYAYQFAEVDKYVVAAPMWNLSIPAILKAYIDYICVTGITFKYTEQGPVGLCKGKKAIYIVGRGGDYSRKPFSDYEMGERYLRTIFAFLGITDFTTIAANGLDVGDEGSIMENALLEVKNKVLEF